MNRKFLEVVDGEGTESLVYTYVILQYNGVSCRTLKERPISIH